MNRGIPRWLDVAAGWAARLLLIALAVVAAVWLLARLRLIVLSVFAAALITVLLAPPARWLQARGLNRSLATAIAMLVGLAVLGGVGYGVVNALADQAGDLGQSLQEVQEGLLDWLENGPLAISQDQLALALEEALAQARQNWRTLVGGALGGTVLALEAITGLLLAIVLAFFFVRDGDVITGWLVDRAVPEQRSDLFRAMGRRAWATLSGYLRGVVIIGVVDALGIGIGLLVIGVPLVVPLMTLVFLGAFIPLVGAFTSGLIAVLIALVSGGVVDALLVFGVVLGVQQLEGNVLEPVVMGRAVRLHPVVVLLVLTAGGILGGIVGAALAVPFTALVVAVAAEARVRLATGAEEKAPAPAHPG